MGGSGKTTCDYAAPGTSERGRWARQWSFGHAVIFAILLAMFSALVFWITSSGLSAGPEKRGRVIAATAGTIAGPMVGAISRGWQRCCVEFSMNVMLVCAPVLAVGVVLQFLGSRHRAMHWLRLSLWTFGWLVWFLGGTFSFLHALE